MIPRIAQHLAATPASTELIVAHEGPIVGAAILGLDALGAQPQAVARARAELQQAISNLGRELVG
jgi:hypothetical protein